MAGCKRNRWKGRQQEKVGGLGGFRENDIVIHSTLCHKLGLKDAKLQARCLPRVRWRSSNKVNNCFTLMHTLVLLEAKLPSCCSWCGGTLCRQGRERRNCCRDLRVFLTNVRHAGDASLVVIYIKKNEQVGFHVRGAAPVDKGDHTCSETKWRHSVNFYWHRIGCRFGQKFPPTISKAVT